MGVCPRGAHVRRRVGIKRKPLSSRKAKWAFRRWPFFLGRTTDTAPLGDRRLIGFDRPAFGFLARPMELGQESSHVRPMKAYAELAPDQCGSWSRDRWYNPRPRHPS